MKLITHLIVSLVMFLAISGAQAAPLKTYVTEFSVSGVQGRDDLKVVLQGVLASRLNPEQVQLVENSEKAELTVAGSYARFGKIFSLDVMIKNLVSNKLTRVFEQGEGEDDLLAAVGRLSSKVDRELAKHVVITPQGTVVVAPVVLPQPALAAKPVVIAPVAAPKQNYQVAAESGVVNSPAASRDAYQVRSEEGVNSNLGHWTSPPITGVFNGIAMGRTLASGEREIFVAGERSIRYYLKGTELKLVAEATITNPAKILAIDTADLDNDGVPELYVTIFDRETLVSRVYLPKVNGLELLSENLPWFFRGIGFDFKSRTIFTQELASGGQLTGVVAELVKSAKIHTIKNPRKMPRSGYVFNFNKLSGADANGNYIVLNEDGYLIISSQDGEDVWKSSNKYGGSENNFKVETTDQRRFSSEEFKWTFMEQRIVITPEGTLLVPHNQGFLSIGNNRSYSKYSLHALQWNGSSMQEKWHTRQNQSYLADFTYDAAAKELILLEVVQKADMFSKGKTVISINKID